MNKCSCFLFFSILALTTPISLIKLKDQHRNYYPAAAATDHINEETKDDDDDDYDDTEYLYDRNNFVAKVKDGKKTTELVITPEVETFTDFIQETVDILNTYDNTAFKDFFHILDTEIRKYHYEGCRFSELMQNRNTRTLLAGALKSVRENTVTFTKANINEIADLIRYEMYDEDVKELLNYINSLYITTERDFNRILNNLKLHTKMKSRETHNDLEQVIRDGVRTVLFNHYTDLNTQTRRELKEKIEKFWEKYKKRSASKDEMNSIVKTDPVSNPAIDNIIKTKGNNPKELEPTQRDPKTFLGEKKRIADKDTYDEQFEDNKMKKERIFESDKLATNVNEEDTSSEESDDNADNTKSAIQTKPVLRAQEETEPETTYFTVPPEIEDANETSSNNSILNHAIVELFMNSTADTLLSLGSSGTIDLTVLDVTTPYSFFTAPLGNETFDPPSSLSPSSSFAYNSSITTSPEPSLDYVPTSSSNWIHSTSSTVDVSALIPSSTALTLEGESFSSHDTVTSHISVSTTSTSSAATTSPASTPPFHVDPSVAAIQKEWLHGLASTTASTPKMVVPKLTSVFDYDFTNSQKSPPVIRRNRKPQKNKSTDHSVREGVTKPQKSKRRHPETEVKTFWHDPPKVPSLKRTRDTQTLTTATKRKLKPDLLLGNVTISVVTKKKKHVGEYEKISSASVESQWILRMHKIREVTKKEWYSDRTGKESKRAGSTEAPTTEKLLRHRTDKESKRVETNAPTTEELLRHILVSAPTTTSVLTTSSPTEALFTTEREVRQETYVIVFVTELARLVATKEGTAVRDVLKHADLILHDVYRSRQLQWLFQPLTAFTKMFAKALQESEIDVIQKRAADLCRALRRRRETLSAELNALLEHAAQLYDDDEGQQLLTVLNDFAAFPNITLNGYWLCNSLINSFLRPYRRLTDAAQRRRLTDAATLALHTSFSPHGTDDPGALRIGAVRQAEVPPEETQTQKEPFSITTRTPRERKRKRRHRSHKKKRGRQRYRIHRIKPGTERVYNQDLMTPSISAKLEWPMLLY
ncbi:hypothetical protein PYW07_012821 [Mythimna separata]|uniref:Uncharacterized protein n=1 Tax=Mythimna separata TaxID=271217 RepID=A0AAD7Y8P4_MYTSE|nr:hypothetical protein PYW07_012821 [Mythimna separata]